MSSITIILFISLIPSIQNIIREEGSTSPSDAGDPYPDAVVSLWRLDLEGEKPIELLCSGALIRSNWILIPKHILGNLLPLYTIGFYTGRSYDESGKMENSAIIEELNIVGTDKLMILVVKPGVNLTTPYTVNDWGPCDTGENSGFFIGWNWQNGSIKHPVSFKIDNKILLTGDRMTNSENFPLGSFLVKEKEIIGISYRISSIEWHNFIKIPKNLSRRIHKMSNDPRNRLQADANGPYPDAVVSFWRLDERRNPEKLLYLGALIGSNWILVPRDSLDTLEPFETIGFYTGRGYRTRSLISSSIRKMEISKTDRFIILVIKPGIRLPTPYVVADPSTSVGGQYGGEFIGWYKRVGPFRKIIVIMDFDGFHIQGQFKISSDNFPLGNLIVKGNDIIAVSHNITEEGKLVFLKLSHDDSKVIGTCFRGLRELRKRRKSEADRLWKRYCTSNSN